MKTLSRTIATFFGVGFCPLIPGTAASAVAVLAYRLILHGLAWPAYVLLVIVLFLAGAAAAKVAAAELGQPDPGRIVIDEVCGQLVASAFLPGTWVAAAVAFALFRF
ncbi:MAG TPA: phosphatidylglycerophosphatase A, partial [Acidobacteriota bacterium]|nr:phosphatidylglycerophosphatase A [Acidobacteriota bacterium]